MAENSKIEWTNHTFARMKLADLVPEAKKALWDGKLSHSIGLLIARIPDAKLQAEATKKILTWGGHGDTMSYRRAAEVVQRDYMLRLSEAPWKTGDATLLPDAGACTTCQFRTGNQKDLFGDVKGADVCTKPPCFQAKQDAYWARLQESAKERGHRILPPSEETKVFDRYSGRLNIYGGPYVDGHSPGDDDQSLGKGERAILTVLAQYPHGKDRRALGTLSGYSSSGGSFGTYLSRLRTKGYIEGSDLIRITDAGLSALGEFEPLPRGEELQQYWLARLGKGEAAILRVLLSNYPHEISRDELGQLAGYEASGGSFGTYLSRLRTKELIDSKRLIASEAFFE